LFSCEISVELEVTEELGSMDSFRTAIGEHVFKEIMKT
jgi:hypothetical protein